MSDVVRTSIALDLETVEAIEKLRATKFSLSRFVREELHRRPSLEEIDIYTGRGGRRTGLVRRVSVYLDEEAAQIKASHDEQGIRFGAWIRGRILSLAADLEDTSSS